VKVKDASVIESRYESEVAIIGMSGRFPGARDVDEFWRNLRDGVESIEFFSDEELEAAGIAPALLRHPNYVKAGAVLADVEMFAAAFFGFSPREAALTDPQHRLFLECAWEALENAGYDPHRCQERIGVYAGAGLNTYVSLSALSAPNPVEAAGVFQAIIASDKDFLSTRVSYKLNLTGPSITVQTACSTSLVAIHLACQSLLNGECDVALAGGVRIKSAQKAGYVYQEGGISSPDGHCRAFDAGAQGTVGGSGVGVVVLKRLADALADRDYIHAVIRGSAVNNDGSAKVGYTAPSVDGQTEVIAEALAMAGVEPETVTYVEAHGTGTALGDPIEIAALRQAFRASTAKKDFCAIGSVKTNIGHLDAAAGVAGLIKTVLALRHKEIPPSLHFEQPNPKIDFANSPFYVNTKLRQWNVAGQPRRAGVSSFGMGGTNAHVVLEEAPPAPPAAAGRAEHLLVLSAKTEEALERATANLVAHLCRHPEVSLADVAYTLQMGRRPFAHRRALVCEDVADAVTALGTVDSQRVFTAFAEPRHSPLSFMFPGQGAQYVNMGRGLYEGEPSFRAAMDHCATLLEPHLGFNLLQVLYPASGKEATATAWLNETATAQPALFVIEYALARLWQAWGLEPEAMIGHSIGEYVAACLAGVFALEDALALVVQRGRLVQQLPGGSMLGVSLAETEIQPFLDGRLSLAAINGPQRCTVSGPDEAIDALQARLEAAGIGCRRLHTSHAFHSAMMEPILDEFAACVGRVALGPPTIPFVSNVTGTWIAADEATEPRYWAKHLRQTVRFADGLRALLAEENRVLLEVGPGRTLGVFARQQGAGAVFASLRHPQAGQADRPFLLNTLGRLWLSGLEIDWRGFYGDEQPRRVPLPTYPFARERYWIEPSVQTNANETRQQSLHKKPDVADWFYVPLWKQSVPLKPAPLAEQRSCWLMFCDAHGLGFQIAERLERANQTVITVLAGEEFGRVSAGAYSINPRSSEDYAALLGELRESGRIPQVIVHLWTVTPSASTQSGCERLQETQDSGFYSLLFLAQALGKQRVTHPLRIVVVSSDVQQVTGEEALCPEKATLLGPCRVIPQEYPNIACRSVDVVVPEPTTWQEKKLIDHLVAELAAKPSDSTVAYRGGRRWVQTFEAARLGEAPEGQTRLREGGVYLITGGLGNIGLALAEHLARTVRARLILTGRSAFPEKGEWERWLATRGERDDTSRKIRKVQAIEELAAQVLVFSADAASQEKMQEVVARSCERFGEIHGVIHAAGITRQGFLDIQNISRVECEQHFRPKVHGLYVLEQVLRGKELDFCILVSSLSHVLGGLGFVAYSAANIFMDYLAHNHNRTSPVSWTSVNLEGWRFEGEPAQNAPSGTGLSMTSAEGVQVFERILSQDTATQVVVSAGDLQARIARWVKLESWRDVKRAKEASSSSRHPRPDLPGAYVAPRNEVEQTLADIWQELLGIEQVGVHDNFFELGGDSLLGIQVNDRASQAGLRLAAHHFLERQTIAELAAAANTDGSDS
jgi:acyl transferase domain-containing protein